ncbi:MmcQ/YjbR family DNA-binding protein [Actinomycetes bacterium M1A6_2h]
MTIDDIIAACAEFPAARSTRPFGPTTAVFKVGDKIFAAIGEDSEQVTLKCAPDDAVALVEQFDEIVPGYHMNKKHWITLDPNGSLPNDLIAELLRGAYELVFASLPARVRNALA